MNVYVQMFTAEQTQQLNVEFQTCCIDTTSECRRPNVYSCECRRSKCLLLRWQHECRRSNVYRIKHEFDVLLKRHTIECLCSKCLLLNRHNNWMSTFQMFTAGHNKWMSAFQMFTEQKQFVDVPNVYCWGDMNVDVPNVSGWTDTTNECRRSKCLLQKDTFECRRQMFTAELTQQMNVDVPNVYCWVQHECRRSKCLLLNRNNNSMSTFQMFTAEQTQQMNVDDPNVSGWTDTTNECRRFKCLLQNRHHKWMST